MVVLKLGGELIESPEKIRAMGRVVVKAAKKGRLVVVHGGGREIDAALAQMGIAKHQVDGLRVTDDATLEVVVSVLAGTINTHFVAAINAAGGKAVGLSGADAGVAPVKKAPAHKATSGHLVDLGMVGWPINAPKPALPALLSRKGYVPVIACVSAAADGRLFNVNADTLAGSLAARLKAKRLVIAGATAGVLDAKKRTLASLNSKAIAALVSSGTANAGMVAKLKACQAALKGGAKSVWIVDGRDPAQLSRALSGKATKGTTEIES
ncbi:MAG: acetylglutamate kinase [Vicinamibacterales bacterium]